MYQLKGAGHESVLKIYRKKTHATILLRNLHLQYDFYLPFFLPAFSSSPLHFSEDVC
jgi:hypothetical protein